MLGLLIGAVVFLAGLAMGSGPAGGPPTDMYRLAAWAVVFFEGLALLQFASRSVADRMGIGRDAAFLSFIAIAASISFYILSRVLK